MRRRGWITGYPWCASFVRAIVLETLEEFGIDYIKDDVAKTLGHGVVNTCYNMLKSPLFKKVDKPEAGDIVCWDAGGGKGHMAFYLAPKSATQFETVEGNTNAFGSREGEYVATKFRTMNPNSWKLLGFFRLDIGV